MTSPRPYTKTRRAELEQQTRERITGAAVELHGSLGPARTTVSAIAQRADVQRATVYRHFPDEDSLFAACSAHWRAQNEPPDLAAWAAIRDPAARLAVALAELYAWYAGTERMLELLIRDLPVVPAVQSQFRLPGYLDAAADVLLAGRPERGAARRRARAALGHAVAFETWLSLVRQQGLTSAEAIRLMERMTAR
ncbi:MAG TPA: helix-turn-helix domain-containing protein [Gaiellales bacterium]|nr:helix-turn-helix domain-containing protein [Gaiellales bacterium]